MIIHKAQIQDAPAVARVHIESWRAAYAYKGIICYRRQ